MGGLVGALPAVLGFVGGWVSGWVGELPAVLPLLRSLLASRSRLISLSLKDLFQSSSVVSRNWRVLFRISEVITCGSGVRGHI